VLFLGRSCVSAPICPSGSTCQNGSCISSGMAGDRHPFDPRQTPAAPDSGARSEPDASADAMTAAPHLDAPMSDASPTSPMDAAAVADGPAGLAPDSGIDAATERPQADGPAVGGWTDRTTSPLPSSWPTSRFWHVMIYDSVRDVVVLFGGVGPNCPNRCQEVWEWSSRAGTWTDRTPASIPASWPSARDSPGLAYDSARRVAVLFGGFAASVAEINSLWEWDGGAGTWTNRTPSPLPGSWPSVRSNHALVYDSARGRTVLFGGSRSGSPSFRDTWEWDGASGTWTDRTPSTLPPSWPEGRHSTGVAYDDSRGRAVIFGGRGASTPYLGDLWEWDGTMGTWTNRTPPLQPTSWPSPRGAPGLGYNSLRQKLVLFGGESGRSADMTFALDDTWEWDGATGAWANLTPSPRPPRWPDARAGHALSYAGGGKVLLFGGADPLAGPRYLPAETWEWLGPP
jgi:hypothetical protein